MKNKKFYKNVLSIVMTLFLMLQSMPLTRLFADSNSELGFSASLERAILEVLELDTIDHETLENTIELDLENRNIDDLAGIDNFLNLKSINLDGNKIKDIQPLNQLEKLSEVSLNNQEIDVFLKETNNQYILTDLIRNQNDEIIEPQDISHEGAFDGEKITWDAQTTLEERVSYVFSDTITLINENPIEVIYSGTVSFNSNTLKQEIEPEAVETINEIEKEIEEIEDPKLEARTAGDGVTDPTLLKALNDILGRGQITDPISDADMLTLPEDLDLRRRSLTTLEGLEKATHLQSLDISNNNLMSGDLGVISSLPIKSLKIDNAFNGSVSDLIISGFSELTDLKIEEERSLASIKSFNISNLTSFKKLSFNGSAFERESDMFKVEDLPELTEFRIINSTGAWYYVAPKSLVLKNLPKLDLKLYNGFPITHASSKYVWYGGIYPYFLKELEIDNVPKLPAFSLNEAPESMLGAGENKNLFATKVKLEKISVKNSANLKTIDVSGSGLETLELENLPIVEEIDISNNKLSNQLEKITGVPLLNKLDFSKNKIDKLDNLKTLIENSLSDELKVFGNENMISNSTALNLNQKSQNLDIKLLNQKPILSSSNKDVDIFGNYTLNIAESNYKSPYSFDATNISNAGVLDGENMNFKGLRYNSPTSISFNFASTQDEPAKNNSFEFTGKAVQPLNYPLKNFEGTIISDRTKAKEGDIITYELKFNANGDENFEHKGVEVKLPIPNESTFVDGSVEFSDPNNLATHTVTWDDSTSANVVAINDVITGTEYVIKYKVKVNAPITAAYTRAAATLGDKSYASKIVYSGYTALKKSLAITEKHQNRLGTEIHADTSTALIQDDAYTGSPQTISNYIYIGYKIGNGNAILDGSMPTLANVQRAQTITYIYGLQDAVDATKEQEWDITEEYVNRNGNIIGDSTNQSVTHFLDYTGYTKPQVKSIDNFVYVGYKIDDGALVEVNNNSAKPSIVRVEGTHKVTYVYGVEDPAKPGSELKHKVTETYIDRNGDTRSTQKVSTIPSTTAFNPTVATVPGYMLVSYKVNGEEQTGTPNTISSLTEDLEIVYIYGKEESAGVEQQVTVTEKFIDRKGRTIKSPDNNVTLYYHETYEKMSADSISEWVYLGWRESGSTDINQGLPRFENLKTNKTVEFVYGWEDVSNLDHEKEYIITEKYQLRNGQPVIVSGVEKEDNLVTVYAKTDYKGVVESLSGYVYVGYKIGETGTLVPAVTGSTPQPEIIDVMSDEDVIFVYGEKSGSGEKVYQITEKYVDRNGDEIAGNPAVTKDVFAHDVYNDNAKVIPNWIYVGYRLDNGALQENEQPSINDVVSNHTIEFVYGVNDGSDQELTYDITEKYQNRAGSELMGDTQTTVFAHDLYQGPSAPAISGYIYVGYKIGSNDTLHTGNPRLENVQATETIIYVYGVDNGGVEQTYMINETYVDRNGSEKAVPTSTTIPAFGNYTKTAPTISRYVYIGYHIDGEDTLYTGDANISDVQANASIEFVYAVDDGSGNELFHTINETYVNRLGQSIKPATTSNVSSTTTYKNTPPATIGVITKYVYVGYRWNNETEIHSGTPEKANIIADAEVEYIYGKEDSSNPGHELKYTFTESYVDRSGEVIEGINTTTHEVFAMTDYNKVPQSIPGYVYIGYKLDDGTLITGNPDASLNTELENIDSDHNIEFVYGVDDGTGNELTYTITIDRDTRFGFGLTSQPTTINVPAGSKYVHSSAPAIANHVYIGYKIDDNDIDFTQEMPKIDKVEKDYKIVLIYGVDNNNDGQEDIHKISETFVDINDEALLDPSEEWIYGDGTYQKTAPTIEGYVYIGWHIDNWPIMSTDELKVANINSNHSVKLVYAKEDPTNPGQPLKYTITEKHVNRNKDIVGTEVAPKEVYAGESYSESAQTIANYIYLGYKVNDDAFVDAPEVPSIASVNKNTEVLFIYGADSDLDGVEDTHNIVETYVDRRDNQIKTTSTTIKYTHESFSATAPTIDGYIVIGYYLDNGTDLQVGDVKLTDITSDHSIKYVYGLEDSSNPGHELVHTITEKHVNRNGDALLAEATTEIPSGNAYNGSSESITDYIYLGYSIDGGALILGSLPTIDPVTADVTIEYLYGYDADGDNNEDQYTVTEKFETIDGTQLQNSNSVSVTAFDKYVGASAPDHSPVYVYDGYKIGTDPTIHRGSATPEFAPITESIEITYVYKDGDYYTVTEKFVNRNGDELPGSTPQMVHITESGTYTNTTPDNFVGYLYVGYRIDSGDLETGYPTITDIMSDKQVDFVYGADSDLDGEEDTHDIVEMYVDRRDNTIKTSSTTIKYTHESFSATAPAINGYVVIGYYLDNGTDLQVGNVNITDITADHSVKYVYGIEDSSNPGHELVHTITEKHVNRNGDALLTEATTEIPSGNAYNGSSESITDYIYLGYSIDGGALILGSVPIIDPVNADVTIEYLYGYDADGDNNEDQYTVTEQHQDRFGNTISTATTQNIYAFDKYIGSTPLYPTYGGNQYIYIGYKNIDTGELIETTEVPSYHPVIENMNVVYVYGIEDSSNLGHELKVIVNETFVDRNGEEIKAAVSKTMPAGSNYIGQPEVLEGFIYLGYRVGNDPITLAPATPNITTVMSDIEVVYVYGVSDGAGGEQQYTITEKYAHRNGDELIPGTTQLVAARDTYSKTAPNILGHVYIGYRINDELEIQNGQPSFTNVNEDFMITYVYGDDDGSGIELTFNINETFIDRLGNLIGPMNETTTVFSNTRYEKSGSSISGYVYLGYRLDGGNLQTGSLVIDLVSADHQVEFVYGIADPSDHTQELLHTVVEQYVDRNGEEISSEIISEVESTLGFTGTLKSESGYIYLGYILDEGTLETGTPTIASVTADHTIKYLYGVDDGSGSELTYQVTEKFEHRNGTSLSADETQTVYARDRYVGIIKPIDSYVYVGYKVNDGELQTGAPEIVNVRDDYEVTLVYGTEDPLQLGVEKFYDITINYVNRIGGNLKETETITIPANTYYDFELATIEGYVYLGYIASNGSLVKEVPTLNLINEDVELELLYGIEDPNNLGQELVYTVEETYVDQDGKEISVATSQDVIALLGYKGIAKEIDGYKYLGYRVIPLRTRALISNELYTDDALIESLNEYVRIEYLYQSEDSLVDDVLDEEVESAYEVPETGVSGSIAQQMMQVVLSGFVLIVSLLKRKKSKVQ